MRDTLPIEMVVFGMIGQSLGRSETTAALIGLTILGCAAIGLLIRWVGATPVRPEPWNEEVAAELARDDCPQICHRCLTPHGASAQFCSHCGAIVGTYTSILPPLYLYVIGDVFRAGAEGAYRRSPVVIIGGFLAAINYAFWVPIPFGPLALLAYWVMLFRNIPRRQTFESKTPDHAPR